jgi:hypothetical protein
MITKMKDLTRNNNPEINLGHTAARKRAIR